MTTPCVTPVNGQPPVTAFRDFYIGKPGAMTKIRLPDAGLSANLNRSEVAHQLSGGGVTTTRRRRVKRQYGLSFSQMTPDDAEALVSYYSGARGNGPFAVLDPRYRNQLTLDGSTMSSPPGAPLVWTVLAADGQPSLITTPAPPIAGSAVLKWPAAAVSHSILNGDHSTAAYLPYSASAVPWVSDQPYCQSIYLRASSGTPGVALFCLALTDTGWDGLTFTSFNAVLSTAWQRFSVPLAAGAWSSATVPPQYVGFAMQQISGLGPDIYLACAQTEIGVTSPRPWTTGLGVPRCTISQGVPDSSSIYWRRNHGLTLSEV